MAARAGVAERAVQSRHLRRVWCVPGTLLGVAGWPPTLPQRLHLHWNYWWQAHVLDCLVDAQLRSPTGARAAVVANFVRGVHLRNFGSWTNVFYDDMAWLGLALVRAAKDLGVYRPRAEAVIASELRGAWTDHAGGGIWWRKGSDFKNVPANGPTAILLARLAVHGGERTDLQRARSTVEWIDEWLVDPDTGLVWDGLHVDAAGVVTDVEKTIYTYCQGVYLGACLELARADGTSAWLDRAERVIAAVAGELTVDGVLVGHGGGDGGLFSGILARYLAQAAVLLPGLGRPEPARLASALVYDSAEAAWRNRGMASGGPLFGPDWSVPAVEPTGGAPERDLSVQVGAWMVLEAAALLERS
ncbi:glycoside hydrolase [Solihabitans fulvus]|uniref:Glycoside hydrolase n=1 Tax=Solihabitans fulvus TaxID=1892852 RepID=A0A5B2WAV3_9PSEU|nr:glycoside hydrolase family 76 protein [Solihabitans fulvus]KAA2248455.1 glycoside hydrolase [Solihabitans fulvus]